MLWLWIGGAVMVLGVVRWALRTRGTAGKGSQGDLDHKIGEARVRSEGRNADWL
jgi:hypothetical protein